MDPLFDHPSVRTVTQALEDLQVQGRPLILEEHVRTAALAAAALGIEAGAIANSLVFVTEDDHGHQAPLLVMASGAHRCDTSRLAAALAVRSVKKADPDFVRQHTGFAIGGVAPIGHPHPITTLVDVHLAEYKQVWAAAGHPRTVFPTHYDELLRITGGQPVEVV